MQARPYARIWLFFFAYSAFVALAIQLVLLPYVFPRWHWGEGLLIPPGDWVSYHLVTAKYAAQYHADGWKSFTLYPEGGVHVVILTLIYYLTLPKPWTLIPLLAGLHATGAWFLVLLCRFFTSDRRVQVLSAIPFLVFPSAILWYGQIHRDGYAILGYVMFVYSWVSVARAETWAGGARPVLRASAVFLASLFLLWIGRQYSMQALLLLSLMALPVLSLAFVLRARQGLISTKKAAVAHAVMIVFLLVLYPMKKFGHEGVSPDAVKHDPERVKELERQRSEILRQARKESKGDSAATFGRQARMDSKGDSATVFGQEPTANLPAGNEAELDQALFSQLIAENPEVVWAEPPLVWKRSGWLPELIENQLFTLATIRDGFRRTVPRAATNIDLAVRFHDAWDVIRYTPRAIEIGIFAPFPSTWSGRGSAGPGVAIRRVTGIEMLVNYIGLLFLALSFRSSKRIEFWLVIFFSLGMMTIQGFAITNVGTIYRLRYGYMMTLVTLGMTNLFEYVSTRRRLRARVTATQ